MRIARARPLTAIAELIWNSLDADANNVTVYFDENELGLRGVVVEDDGQGATPDEAREFFRRLGGSWKRPGARTKKHGRVLHGSQGQGRYKALSVGRSIKWTYYYQQGGDIYEFTLSILGDDPSEVSASDPRKSVRDRKAFVAYATPLWDEKGHAQVFCDRLFQAFGHEGSRDRMLNVATACLRYHRHLWEDQTVDWFVEAEAEKARLKAACDAGDLLFVFSRYPIRETPALSQVATKLGFPNLKLYESSVRKLLMDDPDAVAFVQSLFGDLTGEIAAA
ncbi:ATP-binding protein [Phenylobacterium sp.]|uniref:ATP-binding protein n=1 Tax=Phenylobacterium sp. TaxID=1871053 RepID=UPI003BAC1A00